jgi:hypothetical protein
MTETTTETPAQRRYTGCQLDRIEACEYATDPFTDAELDIIDVYDEKVAGIEDSLDPVAASALPEDWRLAQACAHFQAMARMLRDWRASIDGLATDLTCVNQAGARFISNQLMRWQASREAQLAAIAEYMLGREPTGERFIYEQDTVAIRHQAGAFWAEMKVL